MFSKDDLLPLSALQHLLFRERPDTSLRATTEERFHVGALSGSSEV